MLILLVVANLRLHIPVSGTVTLPPAPPACPGDTITFTCTNPSSIVRWEVPSLGITQDLDSFDLDDAVTVEPFVFVATNFVSGELTSTATVNATTVLGGREIVCIDSSLENNTATIQVIGEYVQHFYL